MALINALKNHDGLEIPHLDVPVPKLSLAVDSPKVYLTLWFLYTDKNRKGQPHTNNVILAAVLHAAIAQISNPFYLGRSDLEKILGSNQNVDRSKVSGDDFNAFMVAAKANGYLKELEPPSAKGVKPYRAGKYQIMVQEVADFITQREIDYLAEKQATIDHLSGPSLGLPDTEPEETNQPIETIKEPTPTPHVESKQDCTPVVQPVITIQPVEKSKEKTFEITEEKLAKMEGPTVHWVTEQDRANWAGLPLEEWKKTPDADFHNLLAGFGEQARH